MPDKQLVIDGHNGAFMDPWIKVPFYNYVLRNSSVVLVHNEEFYKHVREKFKKINFFTLPDSLPDLSSYSLNSSGNIKYFLVILSFAYDEPLKELFTGIKEYLAENSTNIEFYITGNFNNNIEIYNNYNALKDIKFLGFIDDEKYLRLLKNAFGIISLSTREMVQQCAVVEAVGAEVPLVCSDNETNRRIFNKGAILTRNNHEDIYYAIQKFVLNETKLRREIQAIKNNWQTDFENKLYGLKLQIDTHPANL